jgi:16S rRNA G966 N2-methylase RsmD
VLRESIKDELVDLIYLDPPFNSIANCNVLFKARPKPDNLREHEIYLTDKGRVLAEKIARLLS